MIKKFRFSIATKYSQSKVEEIVEIEFNDAATPEEIENEVNDEYVCWVAEQNRGGWSEIEE